MTAPVKVKLIPEIVPGGMVSDPYDNRWKQLEDALSNLQGQIANINLSVTTITGSVDSSYQSVPTPVTQAIANGGNRTLLYTIDNQFVWIIADQTGAGVTSKQTYYGVKMAAPYTTWTALDGTFSPIATTLYTQASGNAAAAPLGCPLCVQDRQTQDLWLITPDNTATRNVVSTRLIYNGNGTWTPGATTTIDALAVGTVQNLGGVIQASDNALLYICPGVNNGSVLANIYRGVITGVAIVWTPVANYATGGLYPTTGQVKRLVQMDGTNILALMEFYEATGPNRANLAYAVSADNGVTWSAVPDGKFLVAVNANMVGGGNSTNSLTTWDATAIPSSTRAAVVYAANAAVGTAGVKYAEFDRVGAAWTAQASHFNLNAQTLEQMPRVNIDSTGTIRVMWLHNYGSNSNLSLFYRRTNGSSPLTASSWKAIQAPFPLATRGTYFTQEVVPIGTLLNVGGQIVWPFAFTIRDSSRLVTESAFKFLRTGLIDV